MDEAEDWLNIDVNPSLDAANRTGLTFLLSLLGCRLEPLRRLRIDFKLGLQVVVDFDFMLGFKSI